MGLVGIPFNGLPLIWRTDANLLSWEINIQVSLLLVVVFPRDPYLDPCYLSSLSMTYRFMSLYQELICTNYSSTGRLEGTLNSAIAEIVEQTAN